nr:MAG TPA: Repressor protein CI [Caudoviricetes sp.]
MTDEEQKRIFSKNLNKYMALNQKQQIDVAKDLGINPTTLNMWCKGNSMPNVGKIQKLADYFKIGKSDLTDEKGNTDFDLEYSDIAMKIGLADARFKRIIIEYSKLPTKKKDLLCEFFEKFIF